MGRGVQGGGLGEMYRDDNERGGRGAVKGGQGVGGSRVRVTLRYCARVALRCLSRGGAGGARALRPTSCSDEIGQGREGGSGGGAVGTRGVEVGERARGGRGRERERERERERGE